MANTLTLVALRANTTKIVEFYHPTTNAWTDGIAQSDGNTFQVVLTGVTAGTFAANSLQFRLKGSNPVIGGTFPNAVTVLGSGGGGTTPGYSGTPLYLAFVGDSLTCGYVRDTSTWTGSAIVSRNGVTASSLPPSEVQRGLLDTTYFKSFANYGYAGQSLSDMVNNTAAREETGFANSGLSKGLLVVQIGANGGYGDVSGFAATLSQYVAAKKAKNLYCIVRTSTNPAANLDAWNAYVRANYQAMGFVGLSDLYADARAQNSGNTTYFQPDGQHYTDPLNAIVAQIDKPVILGAANALPAGALPAITNLSPSTQQVGQPLTIAGTNLSGATVKFTGASVQTPTANTATSLTVTVPASATSGPVTVTTANGASNALAFTLGTVASDLVTWADASGVTVTDNRHTVTKNKTTSDNFGDGSTVGQQVINISQSIDGEQARLTFAGPANTAIIGVCAPNPPSQQWQNTLYGAYYYSNQGVHNGALDTYGSNADGTYSSVFVFFKDKVQWLYGGTVAATWNETVPAKLVPYFAGSANGAVNGATSAGVSNVHLTGLSITTS